MLAIFDTEGVLIDGEFLPELAKIVGKEEEICHIMVDCKKHTFLNNTS